MKVMVDIFVYKIIHFWRNYSTAFIWKVDNFKSILKMECIVVERMQEERNDIRVNGAQECKELNKRIIRFKNR